MVILILCFFTLSQFFSRMTEEEQEMKEEKIVSNITIIIIDKKLIRDGTQTTQILIIDTNQEGIILKTGDNIVTVM